MKGVGCVVVVVDVGSANFFSICDPFAKIQTHHTSPHPLLDGSSNVFSGEFNFEFVSGLHHCSSHTESREESGTSKANQKLNRVTILSVTLLLLVLDFSD